jgi:hypothetical protein
MPKLMTVISVRFMTAPQIQMRTSEVNLRYTWKIISLFFDISAIPSECFVNSATITNIELTGNIQFKIGTIEL